MYKLPRSLPHEIEKCIPKNSSGIEIECKIRFRDESKTRFKKIIEHFSSKKWKKQESFSIDYYRNEKRFTKIGDKFFNTTKSAPMMIEVIDFDGFDLKFTVSKEKNSETKEPKTYQFKRIKERTSFIKGNISIDLTEVSKDDESAPNYEIEVEVISPERFNSSEFMKVIFEVVETQVDPRIELTRFMNKTLGGSGKDSELNGKLISKPRDLLFKDLTVDGLLDHYAVSVKADGEFRFLVFHSTGIWFIHKSRYEDRNFVKISPLEGDLEGSVFAGEIVPSKKGDGGIFLPFDCCRINGKKVISENYLERRKYLDQIHGKRIAAGWNIVEKRVFTYKKNNADFYRVMKEAFQEIKDVSFGTDGLIFTPIYSDYVAKGQMMPKKERVLSRYQDVCKYKLPEDQTIDFEVIDGRLFSAGGILFKGSDDNPFTEEHYQTCNPEVGLDSEDVEGRIVEFKPYYNDGKVVFKPFRFRDDKSDPNAVHVALDGWNIQKDPILPSTLMGEDVRLLRKYNNTIKREMISKMSGYVVDIGTGKGGDLPSYHRNDKIISVLGVEPNEDFIAEMKSRPIYKQIKKFTLIKGGGEETERIVERLQDLLGEGGEDGCVANINFMISLSFFWKDEETLNSLVKTIDAIVQRFSVHNCKVYINYFSIMGDRVRKLFREHGNLVKLNTITLQRIDENSLRVDIRDSQTVHKQEEYFVDLDELFEKTGFKVVKQETPSGEEKGAYILSKSEKEYNSLFSYGTALYRGKDVQEENYNGPLIEKYSDDQREKMGWIDPDVYRISTLDGGNSLGHSLMKLLNFEYRKGNERRRNEMVSKVDFGDLGLEDISKKLKHGIVVYDHNKQKKRFGDSDRWIMLYQNEDGTYEPLTHLEGNSMSLVFGKDSQLL